MRCSRRRCACWSSSSAWGAAGGDVTQAEPRLPRKEDRKVTMFRSSRFNPAAILVALAVCLPAYAQQAIVYPAKGQGAEQQQKDQGECMAWAQQTTGVNPMTVAQGLANQPPPQERGPLQDERVQGAVV